MLDFLITADEEGPVLIPELDRTPVSDQPALSPREEITVAANTAAFMQGLGDTDIQVFEDDERIARDIFSEGRLPTAYEKTKPGVMLKLEALLTTYDHEIIDEVYKLRSYVTHRLLEESDDDDPKIRLKALELLGKLTDVGLFTERKEITITQKSTPELEALLRSKLEKIINPDETLHEEVEDAVLVEAEQAVYNLKAEDLLEHL